MSNENSQCIRLKASVMLVVCVTAMVTAPFAFMLIENIYGFWMVQFAETVHSDIDVEMTAGAVAFFTSATMFGFGLFGSIFSAIACVTGQSMP